MNSEAPEVISPSTRWNLSDGDDYVEDSDIVEEEPESFLREERDRLIEKIKANLNSDCYQLELKEVPRYVMKKNIEEFFGLNDSSKYEIDEVEQKGKRDVNVLFYDADDFCKALLKNGKSILSYTFDACYNPNARRGKNNRVKQGTVRRDIQRGDSRDEHYGGKRQIHPRNSDRDDRHDEIRDDHHEDRKDGSGDVRNTRPRTYDRDDGHRSGYGVRSGSNYGRGSRDDRRDNQRSVRDNSRGNGRLSHDGYQDSQRSTSDRSEYQKAGPHNYSATRFNPYKQQETSTKLPSSNRFEALNEDD